MGNTVRAKFKCNEITETEYNQEVRMSAVYSDKEGSENKKFTDASPMGDFTITIDKDAPAYGSFEVGEEYYLDITKAN